MKPDVLCILDGCGEREYTDGNAFKNANTPTLDMLREHYSYSILEASGEGVGLPKGQMGTSEVGHMNIGAGRVAINPLRKIFHAISTGDLFNNKEILKVIDHVKQNGSNLHVFGLISDGGVHSHIGHLFGILDMCKEKGVENLYLDLCTDGRDTNNKSSQTYLKQLDKKLEELGIGKINVLGGRYYGMDRDDNFDRIKLYYDALCYGKAPVYNNYKELIEENYASDVTDEFIIPGIINKCPLNDNDGVIVFNFRKDRLREMFTLLTNPNEYEEMANEKGLTVRKYNNLKVVTMYPVTSTVTCPHAFSDEEMKNMLVEYLHKNGLSQMRIAETEKYPHVTFFFDGGKEINYDDMKKVLIPSPKVATYDMQPEMSVYEVTDKFLEDVGNFDVTIMNLANGDMVGHTGNYEAAVEAVEHMDKCLTKIYNKVMELDGILMIIADHGNCDVMWDENKEPVTSHTTNPVLCIITIDGIHLKNGKLADVAPTILYLLGLEVPKEMTGEILIDKMG